MCNPTISDQNPDENQSYISLLRKILTAKGVLILILVNIGITFNVGLQLVAPTITGDIYARQIYGYSGLNCQEASSTGQIPEACSLGSAYAQNIASYAAFVEFTLNFLTGPFLGSLSDRYGRKKFIALGIFFFNLGPIFLLIIQVFPNVNATTFYAVKALAGLASPLVPMFAFLTDVTKPEYRAGAFSILYFSTSALVSIIPEVAAIFGNLIATSATVAVTTMSLLITLSILPETLSSGNKQGATQKKERETANGVTVIGSMLRPIAELKIVNRDNFFRTICAILFLSHLVKGGEDVIFAFYANGQLGFSEDETATYLLIRSLANVFAYSVLLNSLIQRVGERKTLIIAMTCGVVFSLTYGLAKGTTLIYIGSAISGVTVMNIPTIQSIMSSNVEKHEQGTIQGVILSIQALAHGVGPLFLNYVFDATVDGAFLGPGTIFFVGTLLFIIAAGLSYSLSPERVKYKKGEETEGLLSEAENGNVV